MTQLSQSGDRTARPTLDRKPFKCRLAGTASVPRHALADIGKPIAQFQLSVKIILLIIAEGVGTAAEHPPITQVEGPLSEQTLASSSVNYRSA